MLKSNICFRFIDITDFYPHDDDIDINQIVDFLQSDVTTDAITNCNYSYDFYPSVSELKKIKNLGTLDQQAKLYNIRLDKYKKMML